VFDALTFLVEDEALENVAQHSLSGNADVPTRRPSPGTTGSGARPGGEPPYDPEAFETDDIPDQALEFSLPPDAIGRVFVEAPKISVPAFQPAAVLGDEAVVVVEAAQYEFDVDIPLAETEPAAGSEETQLGEESLAKSAAEAGDEPLIDESLMGEPSPTEAETWGLASDPASGVAALSEAEPPERIVESTDATDIELVDAGEPANEDRVVAFSRSQQLAIAADIGADEDGEFGDTALLKNRIGRLAWGMGVAALAVLLLTQFVHYDRHDLVSRPALGPFLQRVYARLGLELSPNWNLKAYEVRQWGAAAASGAQGTLRVRASVVNTADHAQPLPLLRLSLADLAGARVGVRDFEPKEYMPNLAGPERMLEAGRRIDAEVVIVDPGKDAVGFEIDVCLRDDEQRVRCANDPAPAG
jgi:hypothetical protein